MSRVYFHSPSGTAELLGPERAHAATVVQHVALGALDAFGNRDRLRELLNPEHHMARMDTTGAMITWAHRFETALRTDDASCPLLMHQGRGIDAGDLIANTAMAAGSDPVKFLARLHYQCELHGYVEGPNRAWLADIIDQGLDDGILRRTLRYQPPPGDPRADWPARALGWDDVLALLRARDDEPVVMSDNSGPGFPNENAAGWEPPAGTDLRPGWADEAPGEWAALDETARAEYGRERVCELWGQLPKGERWRLGMDGLRARSGRGALLELEPDGWARYRFGHCLTAFDLLADDYGAVLADLLAG
ncbi:hypothetical protein ACFHW2_11990 [Actinomadura sp. LOL_016]|uniref:hypothetical protein n=1 Tax=unclassified Actinomadura TaxID=2626254 RepID=UPI003A80B007